MGRYRNSVYAAVTLLLSGAVGLALATQTTQKRDAPVFGVGITLVAVPVFVTDKAGNSVPGLKAEDFEVEDGGKARSHRFVPGRGRERSADGEVTVPNGGTPVGGPG